MIVQGAANSSAMIEIIETVRDTAKIYGKVTHFRV